MRSSTFALLFAGSVAAQSSVTLFNPFPYQVSSTVTLIGADATATTYKNECPTTNAGVSVVPEMLRGPTPAPTPKARLARQAPAMAKDDYTLCEPYTLKQGASTWAFHFTDPLPGAWTLNMDCKWQGPMTAADWTCAITQSGSVPSIGFGEGTMNRASTTVIPKSEFSDLSEVFSTFAVVGASATSSGVASQTQSGSRSASPTAASGASGVSDVSSVSTSHSTNPTSSTGAGPAGPLPTGTIKLVGGAAGVLAALVAW